MFCHAASTASGTTGCSRARHARPTSPASANCWPWRWRQNSSRPRSRLTSSNPVLLRRAHAHHRDIRTLDATARAASGSRSNRRAVVTRRRALAVPGTDRAEDIGGSGCWYFGALGRVPRLAQRRVILFFWPTRASSANQTSIALGAMPFSRPICARRSDSGARRSLGEDRSPSKCDLKRRPPLCDVDFNRVMILI